MTPEMNSNDRDECLLKAGAELSQLADSARIKSMLFSCQREKLSRDEYDQIAPKLEAEMKSVTEKLKSLGILENDFVKRHLKAIQGDIDEIRSAMGWDKSRES